MKKLILIASLGLMMISNSGFAQKTGYVNLNDLLLLMPERKKAETDIQEYAKQLDGQMKTMSAEYEGKVSDYQSKEALMTEPVRLDKQKELVDLEDRIKQFQQTAQESLQKKQNELLEPMVKKAKKAIEDVAKESGYKQVLDTSSGSVLYNDPADDILNLVKKKLNLGAEAANPAPGSSAPTPAPKK
jgi:outer membrane protein